MRPTLTPNRALSKGSWVCWPCLQKRGKSGLSVRAKYERLKRDDRRFKYGEKIDKSDAEWAIKGEEIREGKNKSMLSILEERGYVNAIAG